MMGQLAGWVAAWQENPNIVLDGDYLTLEAEHRLVGYGTTDLEHDDFIEVATREVWEASGPLPVGYALIRVDDHPLLSLFHPNTAVDLRGRLVEGQCYLGVGEWHPKTRGSAAYLDELVWRFDNAVTGVLARQELAA